MAGGDPDQSEATKGLARDMRTPLPSIMPSDTDSENDLNGGCLVSDLRYTRQYRGSVASTQSSSSAISPDATMTAHQRLPHHVPHPPPEPSRTLPE